MQPVVAEHKESWKIVQAALEIKRLIIQHGINNAKFAEVLMKKEEIKDRQIKEKIVQRILWK